MSHRAQNKLDGLNMQARGGLAEEALHAKVNVGKVVSIDQVKFGMHSTDPQNHSE